MGALARFTRRDLLKLEEPLATGIQLGIGFMIAPVVACTLGLIVLALRLAVS